MLCYNNKKFTTQDYEAVSFTIFGLMSSVFVTDIFDMHRYEKWEQEQREKMWQKLGDLVLDLTQCI